VETHPNKTAGAEIGKRPIYHDFTRLPASPRAEKCRRGLPAQRFADISSRESLNPFALVAFRGIDSALTANTSSKSEPSRSDVVEVEGKIIAVLPGTMFRVQLANGHVVLGHISGKLRKHFIKIAAGDTVKMEMSPYDLEKARITFRVKDTSSSYRPPMRRRH
jgi:translation initiation factor IF-1